MNAREDERDTGKCHRSFQWADRDAALEVELQSRLAEIIFRQPH